MNQDNSYSGQSRTAFLFPGQGSHRKGMLNSLCDNYPSAKEKLLPLLEMVGDQWRNLLEDEEKADYSSSVTAHVALVAGGIVSFRIYRENHKDDIHFLAGHSLGELTALACSGILSDEEVMKMAVHRGLAMDYASKKNPGKMLAVIGLSLEKAYQVLENAKKEEELPVWLANINADNQLVVAGIMDGIKKVDPLFRELGAKTIELNTAGAFHTPLMKPAADQFRKNLEGIKWKEPEIPVVSSRTGTLITSPESLRVALVLQLIQPVQWVETMEFLRRSRAKIYIEAVPSGVLSGLAKRMDKEGLFDIIKL